MLFTKGSQLVDTFSSSVIELIYSLFLQVFSMASLAKTKGSIPSTPEKKNLRNTVYYIPAYRFKLYINMKVMKPIVSLCNF